MSGQTETIKLEERGKTERELFEWGSHIKALDEEEVRLNQFLMGQVEKLNEYCENDLCTTAQEVI